MALAIVKKSYSPKVGPLIIDKIAITFDVPFDVKKAIKKNFQEGVDGSFKTGNYQLNVRLPGNEFWATDTSGDSMIVLQAFPKEKIKTAPTCRLEYNPSKVSTGDVVEHLSQFGISYEGHVLAGRISRIDLAVDIVGAEMDQLLFSASKFSTTENHFSNGRTLYIGGASSNTHFALYDKASKLKKKNAKTSLKALHESLPEVQITRVEARLKPGVPMADVSGIPNPFLRLKVLEVPVLKKVKKNDFLNTFFMLARVSGVYPAQMRLSKEGKKATMDFLVTAQAKWWKPDSMWAEFPHALGNLAPLHSCN